MLKQEMHIKTTEKILQEKLGLRLPFPTMMEQQGSDSPYALNS